MNKFFEALDNIVVNLCHRPVKYLPQRWSFAKKVILPIQILTPTLIVLAIWFTDIEARKWILASSVIVLAAVIILSLAFKNKVETMRKEWYIGKYNKWLALVLF